MKPCSVRITKRDCNFVFTLKSGSVTRIEQIVCFDALYFFIYSVVPIKYETQFNAKHILHIDCLINVQFFLWASLCLVSKRNMKKYYLLIDIDSRRTY